MTPSPQASNAPSVELVELRVQPTTITSGMAPAPMGTVMLSSAAPRGGVARVATLTVLPEPAAEPDPVSAPVPAEEISVRDPVPPTRIDLQPETPPVAPLAEPAPPEQRAIASETHLVVAVTGGHTALVPTPPSAPVELLSAPTAQPVIARAPTRHRRASEVAPGPAVDFNYEITSYALDGPGEHTIEWRPGALASNVLTVTVSS